MPTYDQLLAIAFKSELTQSKRQTKTQQIAESQASEQATAQALEKILTKVAGANGLENLIVTRLLAQEKNRRQLIAREQLRAEKISQHKQSNRSSLELDYDTWQVYFDGSAHPNPGKMSIGGVLITPSKTKIEISQGLSHGDSNEAEFYALNAVLICALEQGAEKIVVFGDSRTVIDSVNDHRAGTRRTTVRLPYGSSLQQLCDRATQLAGQFKEIRLIWIPRKKNAEADALSQKAAKH